MFEHVGEKMLPTYFARAMDLVQPRGVFLNHGITRRFDTPPRDEHSFSDTYVFPDGELVPISTSLSVAEEAGFEVRDVESLREHYALTLRQWVQPPGGAPRRGPAVRRRADLPRLAALHVRFCLRLRRRAAQPPSGAVRASCRGMAAAAFPLTRADWYTDA